MTALFALACVFSAFEVTSLPLSAPDAHVFLAAVQAGRPARVCVLDGHALVFHQPGGDQPPQRVMLDSAVGAVDVADLNGDGLSEVIAVAGDRILRYAIPTPEMPAREAEATELFTLRTQLANVSGTAFPYVLVVEWEGAPALALPTEEAFEIRRDDGTLLAAFPVGDAAPQRVTYGRPFSSRAATPPQAGSETALELTVRRVSSYEPDLPLDVLPLAPPQRGARRSGGIFARSQEDDYARWLWFPLEAETDRRVFFALAPPRYDDTLLAVQREGDTPGGRPAIAPPTRFPGMLIPPGDVLPDLNGDGYTDVLLWSAPRPGVSVDALTRALLGRTWPVRVTAHVFDPERQRYDPRPRRVLECRVPVAWFIEAQQHVPLRHIVLADFDGSGQTGIGASCAENRFSLWLGAEGGDPVFSHEFDEPIEGVAFAEDIRGNGRTVVGLRTRNALHVVQGAR